MIAPDPSQTFSDIDLDNYEVPAAPKYIECRGFIYIIQDSAFPGFFKLGRSQSLKKRLMQYNSDRPFPTVRYSVFSTMFADVHTVEEKILEKLYEETPPTTFSREWFTLAHIDRAIELIELAEKEFEHAS